MTFEQLNNSVILSAITLTPLSAVVENIDYSFFNTDRNFTTVSAMSSYEGVNYVEFYALQDSVDVSIKNDNLTFLTKSKYVDFLDASLNNKFNYYRDDTTVDIKSVSTIKSNFLLTSPYNDSLKYNVIPLKSSQGTNGEYDYNKISSVSREYDAIYQMSNSNIIAQYKTSTVPIIFKSDNYTNFFIPNAIACFPLSSSGFYQNGSIGGNCPANSDLIFIDQFDTNFIKNNFNGVPLCLWLSGNSWMERWYDPNNISQGNALLPLKNTLSAINPVVDIKSTFLIKPKMKMSYLRHGKERNVNYVDSLSANIVLKVDEWTNRMQYDNIDIFAVSPISDEVYGTAKFDGTYHYHIPPTTSLHDTNDMTVGMWVNQDSWTSGIDTQYFGNFSNGEGYGLFYNTGSNSNLLTLPNENGMVYSFNPKGVKVLEKSLLTTLGVSSAKIDYITTDTFGTRWIYDSSNQKIYQLQTDDIINNVIDLPSDANISKMEINRDNNLYVYNTTSKVISGFDSNGALAYGPLPTFSFNTFTFDNNNALKLDYADHTAVDSENNIFKINGINLYKNGSLYYHVGERVSSLKIDSDDNIWILRKNKLLKLDSMGFKKLDKTFNLPFTISDHNQEMGFVKDIVDKKDRDTLWLIFNTNNYILKIDTDGNILKRINIKDVVNLRACGEFTLNVKGSFSNYDIKRKYSRVNDAVISSTNPAISVKVNLKCGSNTKIVQVHSGTTDLQGWNHLAFGHSIKNDKTYISCYINGILAEQEIVNGIYFIDHGTLISPFIIGGHSGKLGARNVERSLNNEGYFQGKIDDLRIYDIPLNEFEIKAISRNLYWNKWNDMIWFMPTPPTTQMEEIVSYHLNRYKGHKSNKYNIRLKNMGISDTKTQLLVASAIRKILPTISPVHTELHEVIFD